MREHRRSIGGRRSFGGAGRRSFGESRAFVVTIGHPSQLGTCNTVTAWFLISGSEGNPVASAQSEAAIREMYEKINEIITLSSENKITTKNAWSIGMNVDTILETALDEGIVSDKEKENTKNGEAPMRRRRSGGFARAGVNFQKASCKLDASVKIYSVRVDDTHDTSYRILANLTRTGAPAAVDQGSDAPAAIAKAGTKATSNKFNVANTLEKNVSNLNGAAQRQLDVDPSFHKVQREELLCFY